MWSARVLDGLRRDPDAPAIISVVGGAVETWTRSDLLQMAMGAMEFLDVHDVPEREYVPALLTTRPTSVAMLLGGALSHRPLAPLGPRMTERELLACLDRLDGGLLIAEPEWADKAAQLGSQTGRQVAILDRLTPRSGDHDSRPDPDGVAFMMHTSGTTGFPNKYPYASRRWNGAPR